MTPSTSAAAEGTARPGLLEKLFFVGAFILLSGGVLPFFIGFGPVWDGAENNVYTVYGDGAPGKQLAFAAAYALALLLFARRMPLARAWSLGLPLFLLTAWSLASASWSIWPQASAMRAFALAGSVMIGLYAALALDAKDLLDVLAAAAAVLLALSVGCAVLRPDLGFDVTGQMRGAFQHKNIFGSFIGVAILTFACRLADADASVRRRAVDAGMGLLYGACLLLSHSVTPLTGAAGALAVCLAGRLPPAGKRVLVALSPALVGLLAAALGELAAHLGELLAVLGRDATFTGRTPIWRFSIEMIGKNPLLGYGYGVFWLGPDAPGAAFWHRTGLFEAHSHDGYLELLLDVGWVGGVLFLLAALTAVARLVHLALHAPQRMLLWRSAFLTYYFLCGITEIYVWEASGNSLPTALFVYVVARTNLEFFSPRARAAPAGAAASTPSCR